MSIYFFNKRALYYSKVVWGAHTHLIIRLRIHFALSKHTALTGGAVAHQRNKKKK